MTNSVPQDRPLLAFYGDDFTGSTDALESLAMRGVPTVLFTDPPSPKDLQQFSALRAFGVAGLTRSLPVGAMSQTLKPALAALGACQPAVVHYKVCSTFDSSPAIGSIGRAIEIGMEVFRAECVPVLVAAPSLGRYCVFGNLFATCGVASEPYRLDRHPSMSTHPITPMDEADLGQHLAKQTAGQIGLFDVIQLERDPPHRLEHLELLARDVQIILIDSLYPRHLLAAGELIWKGVQARANSGLPAFVAGSSGVEAALCSHWAARGMISGQAHFEPVGHRGPMLAICGSCSPVTAEQIRRAIAAGFVECAIDWCAARDAQAVERLIADVVNTAVAALQSGLSAVVHTAADRIASRHSEYDGIPVGKFIARQLGQAALRILERAWVKRLLIAGGDTSSEIARVLRIHSVEMIGMLTRGSPLCQAHAPDSPADGLEITFKGGQIGPVDFFAQVERGRVGASEEQE